MNTPDDPLMAECVQSLQKHIPEVLSAASIGANVEYLDFYELLDEPAVFPGCATGNPFSGNANDCECRFGIMYDLTTPKPLMSVIQSFLPVSPSPSPARASPSRQPAQASPSRQPAQASPSPIYQESPSGTIVLAGSGDLIVDSQGNVWAINDQGLVTVNGVPDTNTAAVIELAFVNGIVWQENDNNLWWSWQCGSWNPPAGTSMSPV